MARSPAGRWFISLFAVALFCLYSVEGRYLELPSSVNSVKLSRTAQAQHLHQTIDIRPTLPSKKTINKSRLQGNEGKIDGEENLTAEDNVPSGTSEFGSRPVATSLPFTTLSQKKKNIGTRKRIMSQPDVALNRQPARIRSARFERMAGRLDRNRKREKRYQYEDTYDWDYEGDALDYELEEKSDVEKFLEDWHVAGMKMVGYLSVILFIVCTCCCMCRTGCRFCFNSCIAQCTSCFDCLLCRDPMYRRFCRFAGPFGLKLSYSDYLKIKTHYSEYAKEQHGVDIPSM